MNIITETKELIKLLKQIKQHSDFVAIDTEFKRKNTYYPKLCLLQLATPQEAAVVDVLSKDLNLQPFFDLIKDESILKVFFSGRQDIEIIYQISKGLIPNPLFDCQIAAQFCGYDNNISFKNIVHDLLGIELDKTYQKTDWTKRPLSQSEFAYALADATYLSKLYLKISELNQANGRSSWVQDEFSLLSNPETYSNDGNWKKLTYKCRTKHSFYIVKEIFFWRENQAKLQNLPRSWILKDSIISDIANKKIKDLHQLRKILLKHDAKISDPHAIQEIISIIHKVCSIDENELPEIPSEKFKSLKKSCSLHKLQKLLQATSQKTKISQNVIATTKHLQKLLKDTNDYSNPILNGWRYDIFGIYAKKLLIELQQNKGIENV